jgi:ketosteroid isomerase-like protein
MASDSQRDVRELEGIRERIMEAENTGNAAFFDGILADEVVIMAPSMPAIEGRAACVGFMHEFLQQFDLRITYVSAEIRVSGDLAFDRENVSQRLAPKGTEKLAQERGKYLWVYSRARDGSWKAARIIWNSSDQPAVGGEARA